MTSLAIRLYVDSIGRFYAREFHGATGPGDSSRIHPSRTRTDPHGVMKNVVRIVRLLTS
jgi:hypothetical protein